MKILSSRKVRLGLFLKVYRKDGEVSIIKRQSRNSFWRSIKAIKNKDCSKFYVRVTYGRALDVFGKMTTFHNDGTYESKKDLLLALAAFTEKGLLDEFEESTVAEKGIYAIRKTGD